MVIRKISQLAHICKKLADVLLSEKAQKANFIMENMQGLKNRKKNK